MIKKMMRAASTLVVAYLLMSSVSGDVRQDVCGEINPNPTLNMEAEFNFQPNFKVYVEAVMPEQHRINSCWMEFSTPRKLLKTTIKSDGLNYELFYDYQHHQTLEYNLLARGRGLCQVHSSMDERQSFYLVPESPDQGKTPKVSEILRLSGNSGFPNEKITAVKTEGKRFRSLLTTQYQSCQKIRTEDGSEAIVKVTHFISDASLARSETGTVPLQVTFEGKFISGPSNGNTLNHIYNFFHYSTSVGDDDFQTPLGIVCKGRYSPNTFPEPPLHIQFGQEIHSSQNSRLLTLKTIYDKEFNFVAEEFFDPMPGRQPRFRFDDFESGLTYQIDRNTNTCEYGNISTADPVNDYVPSEGDHIKMMTPQQFWDREGIEYHYNGMKHFRGLETEAWIGQDEKTGYMYEWYFTYGVDHVINDQASSEQKGRHRVPYKRIFWSDMSSNFISTYYFQVDLTTPPLLLDLSPCYQNQKKFVSLYIKDLTMARVEKDETLILRRAVRVLSKELGVPFTRISGAQIAFRGEKAYLLFDLLDKPDYSSDIITQYDNQPNLAEALKLLKDKAASGELRFEVGTAKYEELALKRPKGGDTGYSAGALAGLCIAMTVVGLAAGGGGGYWFFIRH